MRGISADQFCEDPPSPCTKSAGGSPARAPGRERTVSVSPGNVTVRSDSPAAIRTVLAPVAGAAATIPGSSVEDIRRCYETITRRSVCQPSQAASRYGARAPTLGREGRDATMPTEPTESTESTDPTDPSEPTTRDDEAGPSEADPADSAEQRTDLSPQEDDPLTGIDPATANEADAAEQARVVPVDEDDYR